VQEGVIGLIKAINKFDPKRGNGLMTYAQHWIRGEILAAINRNKRLYTNQTIVLPSKSTLEDDIELLTGIERLPILLERLDERQRYIIDRRWLSIKPLKLRELSAEMGLSMERIRQIEVESIEEMRK
jgi:RNA polymerase sigma factor (sigma-70 family)